MKQDKLMFSRISFCPDCYYNHSPKKDDKAIIWHTTKHTIVIHPVTSVRNLTRGYVPHLFMVDIPIPKDVATVKLVMVCGICGVQIADEPNAKGRIPFVLTDGYQITLSRSEYTALWKKWKDTGLELE